MTQIRSGAHALWRFLIALFAAAAIAQVFLAGYGVFNADDEGKNKTYKHAFNAHGALGFLMTIGALLLLIVALIAWRDRRAVGSSAVLFVLMIVQSVLASGGKHHPIVGAFHPLLGFFILGMSGWLASQAWGKGRGHMHHRREDAPPPLA